MLLNRRGGAGTAIAVLIAIIAIILLVLIFSGYINKTETYSLSGSGVQKQTDWGYSPDQQEKHCVDLGPFGKQCD